MGWAALELCLLWLMGGGAGWTTTSGGGGCGLHWWVPRGLFFKKTAARPRGVPGSKSVASLLSTLWDERAIRPLPSHPSRAGCSVVGTGGSSGPGRTPPTPSPRHPLGTKTRSTRPIHDIPLSTRLHTGEGSRGTGREDPGSTSCWGSRWAPPLVSKAYGPGGRERKLNVRRKQRRERRREVVTREAGWNFSIC